MSESPSVEDDSPGVEGDFHFEPVDRILLTLVAVINKAQSGSGVSITLSVEGGVVSGKLISNKEWLSLTGEGVAAASGTPLGEGLSQVFTMWAEALTEQEDEVEPSAAVSRIGYIHLDNAYYFAGESRLPSGDHPGVRWRGMINKVTGWSLGSFSAPDAT